MEQTQRRSLIPLPQEPTKPDDETYDREAWIPQKVGFTARILICAHDVLGNPSTRRSSKLGG